MATENPDIPTPPTPVPVGPQPAPLPQPAEGAPTADPAQAQPRASKSGIVTLPSRAFAERLSKAKDQGRLAYQAELDETARAKGFADHAAMMAHIDALASQSRPKPQGNGARPAQQSNNRAQQPTQSQPQAQPAKGAGRQQRELERANKKAEQEAKARRRAERRVQAMEAEAMLKDIALGVGIQPQRADQAIFLYRKACEGKSVEDLEKMDEAKFFEALRRTDPYLFGEVSVPATTGPSHGPSGARPPAPGPTSREVGNSGKVDATTMSKEEWAAYKRAHRIGSSATALG